MVISGEVPEVHTTCARGTTSPLEFKTVAVKRSVSPSQSAELSGLSLMLVGGDGATPPPSPPHAVRTMTSAPRTSRRFIRVRSLTGDESERIALQRRVARP